MTEIKNAITIACFMGIITAITDMLAPSGGMKKHLMSLLGLMTLLAVISPFASSGFKLSLKEVDISSDIELEKTHTQADVTEIFLDEAKSRCDEYFTDLLNKNDISEAKVSTKLVLTEDNEVEITAVEVYLADESLAEEARRIISSEVGEAEIIIGKAEDEKADSTVDG
ncbi:MAG: stage III sporulation protein AF [Ruminococcus sp.]|uniref:stage III sporulation protein AF n=1 Tax=Ruminococcus sp. TaxID=41978 RepID=UPI0025E8C337|nr:stage III sporulation protein AF [Ruminococcus sp.]MBO4867679.1 stage III sporulation protein AF [Ruminococcus sp.]